MYASGYIIILISHDIVGVLILPKLLVAKGSEKLCSDIQRCILVASFDIWQLAFWKGKMTETQKINGRIISMDLESVEI